MYRWTDPNDPDGAGRRPEQPHSEEPAWLTDRPEPRSAYLFGDDPDRPADEWHRDQPTARWQAEPAEPAAPWPAEPAAHRQTGDAEPAAHWRAEPTERWQDEPTGTWPAGPAEPTATWQAEPGVRGHADADLRDGGPYGAEVFPADGRAAGGWPVDAPTAPIDLAANEDGTAGTTPGEGRHRRRRGFPRPVLIGGAAAAATLVVSLGVGAVALGGDGPKTDPTAVDDTIAAAPALPGTEETPGDALTTPTPSAAPTTATATPSPTKATRPTPAPSRTTAPSRRTAERSTAPSGGGTKAPVSSGVSAQAREVVNLVNAERAKAGCGALSIDDKLMTAAQRHSQDQADHRNMSHTGSDGSDAGDRLDRVGYAWRTYGENVAWNQKTPAAVMDAWMNSSGHRANILNCAFTEIGVGVANSNGPYWTQVFAAPR
ncbi:MULTISPECIES: CAP domain-containing protein [unclassified Micromonospora]|uniref:CAP domain-containing protein n=1 Tax=unclassified Micromonospora TaxID=2617518 RepID=UPI003331939B